MKINRERTDEFWTAVHSIKQVDKVDELQSLCEMLLLIINNKVYKSIMLV